MSIDLMTIVSAEVALFLIILLGVWIRYSGYLDGVVEGRIFKLIVHYIWPCFVFSKIAMVSELGSAGKILFLPLLGIGSVLVGLSLGWLLLKVLPKRWLPSDGSIATFLVCVAFYNYGFLPIPLMETLFPEAGGSSQLSQLLIFGFGVELTAWTVGYSLMNRNCNKHWWQKGINPPSVAIVLAVLCNTSGVSQWIPQGLFDGVTKIGTLGIPLALLLIGSTIYGIFEETRNAFCWKEFFRVTAIVASLRIVVLPLLFLGYTYCFLAEDTTLKMILALEAAMPCAMFPILFSRHFDGDVQFAFYAVSGTTLLSVITTPLWLVIGFTWLGLGLSFG
ncbi:MAG: AEC family transporter [Pirellulaceae bacterium]|nr:AEC family transporter [Pirellulaceae bacterium]